jgi:KilA-N domain
MAKNQTIEVKGIAITIINQNQDDYISLTDMAKGFGDDTLIYNWIRNKNSVEFLGIWEQLNNVNFKGLEFETFKNEAGANRFSLTPKKWIEATNAIGIISKSGRYGGGTFAHKDIAFEFGSWLSAEFKLYLIKEFQRLKIEEAERVNLEWDVKRMISKANYQIHTDAIKETIVPVLDTEERKKWIYAEEADLLNLIMFGKTAKQWKQENPQLVLNGGNIRDYADLHQLTVLSNLESLNAFLIKGNTDKAERIKFLHNTAIEQLKSLNNISNYTIDKLKSPNLKMVEQKGSRGK